MHMYMCLTRYTLIYFHAWKDFEQFVIREKTCDSEFTIEWSNFKNISKLFKKVRQDSQNIDFEYVTLKCLRYTEG